MTDRIIQHKTILWLTAVVVSLLVACSGGGGGEDGSPRDTLTQRQKDSLVSTLPVPGAGAVGRAMDAADAARARAEQHDTIH